jgi:hypothetical protein
MKFAKINRNSKCVCSVRRKSVTFFSDVKEMEEQSYPEGLYNWTPKKEDMSANSEQKVSASITIHQETYRVLSIDSTTVRRTRRIGTRTNCGCIYLFSKCLIN